MRLVVQSRPTLCDPMDCNLPGSFVHGILQARTLEWVAIPFFRGIFLTQGSNSGLLQQSFGFPGGSDCKESACSGGDLGSISGSRKSPGKESGNSLQYSGLEDSMGRGDWKAPVHGVTKSQTQLSSLRFS